MVISMYEARFGKQVEFEDDESTFGQLQMDWSMQLLEDMAASHAENLSLTTVLKDAKKRSLFDLIYEYKEFYTKKEYLNEENEANNNKTKRLSDDTIVFCVSECPTMMPFQTIDLFCTDDKASSSQNNYFTMMIILSVVAILMLFGSFAFSGMVLRYLDRSNKEKLRYEEKFFAPDSGDDDDDDNDDEKKTVNMAELRLIQISELEKGVELGKGAFGTVYEGNYIAVDRNGKRFKIKVAIKELNRCKSNDEKGYKELTKEIINVRFFYFNFLYRIVSLM
jgi:hypothetical protein